MFWNPEVVRNILVWVLGNQDLKNFFTIFETYENFTDDGWRPNVGVMVVGTIVYKFFLKFGLPGGTMLMFENGCVPFKTGHVNRGR